MLCHFFMQTLATRLYFIVYTWIRAFSSFFYLMVCISVNYLFLWECSLVKQLQTLAVPPLAKRLLYKQEDPSSALQHLGGRSRCSAVCLHSPSWRCGASRVLGACWTTSPVKVVGYKFTAWRSGSGEGGESTILWGLEEERLAESCLHLLLPWFS